MQTQQQLTTTMSHAKKYAQIKNKIARPMLPHLGAAFVADILGFVVKNAKEFFICTKIVKNFV